jgi:hypothetical protein
MDLITNHTRTPSPTCTLNFPSDFFTYINDQSNFNSYDESSHILDSVLHIVVQLRIFGLHSDSQSTVTIACQTSLMDGGTNICVTGDLSNLVGIVDIAPMPIMVAISADNSSYNNCCNKKGFTLLSLEDGLIYWQLCFYCANVVETIISPQAVLASSNNFTSWTQTGYKDDRPGEIWLDSSDGFLTMSLQLECHGGLYYCTTDVFTVDPDNLHPSPPPILPIVSRLAHETKQPSLRRPSKYVPTTKSKQLESELWLLRLGSPGVTQLDHLPLNATSLPTKFDHHPFRFIDFKEQAMIRKQAAQRSSVHTNNRKRCFYMDFGFMRASAANYSRQDKSKDHVVFSYDGYSSYLLIVDEASRYIWVFLTCTNTA